MRRSSSNYVETVSFCYDAVPVVAWTEFDVYLWIIKFF